MTRFAAKATDAHDILAYPELIERTGLLPAEVGPELESQLLSFMAEAEHITPTRKLVT